MHNLNTPVVHLANVEHVFNLFYEIKQENPFLDEIALMRLINSLIGWEYPANRKIELKETLLKLLYIPG